ncbi:MAG: TipAS antibiotic-recognition domain-containing protein [Lactobacillaceae bacterium]|jgi:type I site-specific restriction endonuclease|nr:TipAS antibiotic-recognition domain-containing protein [Lactobacillaceae bacterium]
MSKEETKIDISIEDQEKLVNEFGQDAFNNAREQLEELSNNKLSKINQLSGQMVDKIKEIVKDDLSYKGKTAKVFFELQKEWINAVTGHYSKKTHLSLIKSFQDTATFAYYSELTGSDDAVFLMEDIAEYFISQEKDKK